MRQHLTSVVIGIAIIITALIVSAAYKYKYKAEETITVTGLAEKNFTSDVIVWRGDYSRKMPDLKSAYTLLKNDEATVAAYLKGKNIKASELQFSSVDISKDFERVNDARGALISERFTGYVLRQSFTIQSTDINRIENVSREVTELIEKGIELNSNPPSYYYSKLSDLKVGLLAKASADARLRAETIAKNSGGGLGKIKSANMGVFQITGEHDNSNFEGGGTFNTSSRNKTASITIRIDFAVD